MLSFLLERDLGPLPQQPNSLCWEDFKTGILTLGHIVDESHYTSTNVYWILPHRHLEKYGFLAILNVSPPYKSVLAPV